MKSYQFQKLVSREKRSYLFAALCSAFAALLLFYKLFQNNLYMRIIDYVWIAAVLFLLILGNIIHGFFALQSFRSLSDQSDIEKIKTIKLTFYKSLVINFFIPYIMLIILFLSMKEWLIATIASSLFLMMTVGSYYLDFLPTMKLKSS